MKKQITLFLAIVLVLSLAACGNKKTSIKEEPTSVSITESIDPTSVAAEITEVPTEEPTPVSDTPYGELEENVESGGEMVTAVEDTETEEPYEGTTPEEVPIDAAGIRPEFKEAMDSYEEFFNEYVDFMKSYMEDPMAMMGEYASMMQQYVETMSALEAIDDGTLSNEEAIYYAEVTLRINQKLLEVA